MLLLCFIGGCHCWLLLAVIANVIVAVAGVVVVVVSGVVIFLLVAAAVTFVCLHFCLSACHCLFVC